MAITKKNIEKIIELIYDKKAENILLLDLKKRSPITDYFVICTAQSPLHAQAIADELRGKLKNTKNHPHHIEGYDNGQWVIVDCWDFIVHIFLSEVRQYYGLERLWGDAPQRSYHDQPDNY